MIQGNSFSPVAEAEIRIVKDLPVGTYRVAQNPNTGEFFLKGVDSFDLPSKIYGDIEARSDRILDTFQKRGKNTGVLLSGIKGAGKTMLAKLTSNRAAARAIPTILVNDAFFGDTFNQFIQQIGTACVMIFDEFEKVYDNKQQSQLLTLLDGAYPSNKLFIFTSNDKNNINTYMKNRPGRIFYTFNYPVVDPVFVREFCDDNLADKTQTDSIVNYANMYTFVNFDMIAAMVEEMNRYGENLDQVLTVLNIAPEMSGFETHTLTAKFETHSVVIDERFYDFDPNAFQHNVWTDCDMPMGIRRTPALAAAFYAACNMPVPTRDIAMLANGGKDVPWEALQDLPVLETPDSYETSITFESSMLSGYDSKKQSFTYSFVGRDGITVDLVVSKNTKPANNWKMQYAM